MGCRHVINVLLVGAEAAIGEERVMINTANFISQERAWMNLNI